MEFIRAHKRLITLNILSLISFVLLAIETLEKEGKPMFDIWVYHIRGFFQTNVLTDIMNAMSAIFDPFVLLFATIILFIILYISNKKTSSYIFLFSMTLGLLSVVFFKQIFAIARPIGDVVVSGGSFPSGHATGAAIFFMTILFSLEKKIKDETIHILLAVVAFGLTLLTGFSRLYLGVHWFSDVIAGFALGMFWVTLSFLVFYRYKIKSKH
jgi:undecaprenyl-diphosphatase